MDIREIIKKASVIPEDNEIIVVFNEAPGASVVHSVTVESPSEPNEEVTFGYSTRIAGSSERGKQIAADLIEKHEHEYNQLIDSFARLYFT